MPVIMPCPLYSLLSNPTRAEQPSFTFSHDPSYNFLRPGTVHTRHTLTASIPELRVNQRRSIHHAKGSPQTANKTVSG